MMGFMDSQVDDFQVQDKERNEDTLMAKLDNKNTDTRELMEFRGYNEFDKPVMDYFWFEDRLVFFPELADV